MTGYPEEMKEKVRKHLEEFERQVRTQEYFNNKAYISKLEMRLAYYSEPYECKDKLDCYRAIAEYLSIIRESLRGWEGWIREVWLMNEFDYEDLKKFANELRRVAVEMLKVDYEATKRRQEILEKYFKEKGIDIKHLPPYGSIQHA